MKIPQGRLSMPAKSCRNSLPRTTSNVEIASKSKKNSKDAIELSLRKTVSFDENQPSKLFEAEIDKTNCSFSS
ncbi:Oidioi.mRNA.OKI2018_I69.chr1.g554.t1.cds [Oikopleura dioica]|uniref:Oidioi.mRNA.OKI2018_I69.chr1.g554.t1.cds n=1 Tax=Oikopleura dioica TaxID=34765 RepID=A0ABN7SKQ1_OIKDI|nr:Oidioi.mRNA.OKI2018_I69.chr1.g554.t1.cds [Oikopleura dioica]